MNAIPMELFYFLRKDKEDVSIKLGMFHGATMSNKQASNPNCVVPLNIISSKFKNRWTQFNLFLKNYI
jgi:hypothetical protein